MAAGLAFPALGEPGATLLCLGAHADDLEIGAGGTIAHLVRRHPTLRVHWKVLTSTPSRAEEARASARALLGPVDAEVEIGDLPDGRLPEHFGAVKDAIEACKSTTPTVVLAPWLGDRHQDHRLLAEVVGQTFRDHVILGYEIAKYEGDLGHPNLYVPLTEDEADAKVAHLAEHFPSQHDRQWWDEDLFRATMRLRGVECNRRWAEAFHAPKLVMRPADGDALARR